MGRKTLRDSKNPGRIHLSLGRNYRLALLELERYEGKSLADIARDMISRRIKRVLPSRQRNDLKKMMELEEKTRSRILRIEDVL